MSTRLTSAQKRVTDAMRTGVLLYPPHMLSGTGSGPIWVLADEEKEIYTRVSERTVRSLVQRGVVIHQSVGPSTLAPAYRDAP